MPEENEVSFHIRQLSEMRIGLEVLGPDGAWTLPIALNDAENLANQLIEKVSSIRRHRKQKMLLEYIEQLMIKAPSGSFMMGRDPSVDNRESPSHQVFIPMPLWALSIPVSQSLYRMVMGENPSRRKGDRLPVESVSWFNAISFCNALSELKGLDPAYEVQGNQVYWHRERDGYRLPTEAEWAYLCNANEDVKFSGSNELDQVAWTSENSDGQPQPSGLKQPNAWGLYDMSGSVLEWCWDWYGDYTPLEQHDPAGPKVGASRICRGGAWNRDNWFARRTARFSESPEIRCSNIGFRIVRSIRTSDESLHLGQ